MIRVNNILIYREKIINLNILHNQDKINHHIDFKGKT
jgi:hypothetical protein